MTFTKKKDQFFGPLSTTSESVFPRVPVSQYFGGHFWGHFWGHFSGIFGVLFRPGSDRGLRNFSLGTTETLTGNFWGTFEFGLWGLFGAQYLDLIAA